MKLLMKLLCVLLIAISMGCSRQTEPISGIYKLKKANSMSLVIPVWSHSGDRLVATHFSSSDYKSTIYMFNLTTGEKKPLIQIDGEATAYSWAPEDGSIAVAISGSNKFANGIWLFNVVDGTNEFVSTGEAAAWSPDGSQMAVFSCEQASNGTSTQAFLRLIDLSTDKNRELLFQEDNCLKLAYMTWSADNKYIAFSYSMDTTANEHVDKILLIDLNSKKVNTILTDGSWSPSFSPNGEKLVFINNYTLAVADRDGTCIERKNIGIKNVGDVSWSPDGTKWAVSTLGNIYIIETTKFMQQELSANTNTCP